MIVESWSNSTSFSEQLPTAPLRPVLARPTPALSTPPASVRTIAPDPTVAFRSWMSVVDETLPLATASPVQTQASPSEVFVAVPSLAAVAGPTIDPVEGIASVRRRSRRRLLGRRRCGRRRRRCRCSRCCRAAPLRPLLATPAPTLATPPICVPSTRPRLLDGRRSGAATGSWPTRCRWRGRRRCRCGRAVGGVRRLTGVRRGGRADHVEGARRGVAVGQVGVLGEVAVVDRAVAEGAVDAAVGDPDAGVERHHPPGWTPRRRGRRRCCRCLGRRTCSTRCPGPARRRCGWWRARRRCSRPCRSSPR